MTTLNLHPHVFACRSDDWIIFLDVREDRYLSIASAQVGLSADRRTITLAADASPDRFAKLASATPLPADAHKREHPPTILPRPLAMLDALFLAERLCAGPRTIAQGLAHSARACASHAVSETNDADINFFRKSRILWPRDYVCLFDSLALAGFLSRRAIQHEFVIAVRARPFMAHCWIERNAEILNDDPEFCASFTEIVRQ